MLQAKISRTIFSRTPEASKKANPLNPTYLYQRMVAELCPVIKEFCLCQSIPRLVTDPLCIVAHGGCPSHCTHPRFLCHAYIFRGLSGGVPRLLNQTSSWYCLRFDLLGLLLSFKGEFLRLYGLLLGLLGLLSGPFDFSAHFLGRSVPRIQVSRHM